MTGSRPHALLAALLALLAATSVERSTASPAVHAGDAALRRAVTSQVPRVEAAARIAATGRGGPDAVQVQYDAARDLEEALAVSVPLTEGCQRLLEATKRYAGARVLEMEGVDRLSPRMAGAAGARARTALASLLSMPRACSSGPVVPVPSRPELSSPRSNEIFFGDVVARAPARTSRAVVLANGRVAADGPARPGNWTASLDLAPGPYSIEVRFLRGGRTLGSAVSKDTWLLPPSAISRSSSTRADRRLAAKLSATARTFSGYSAMWVQHLPTGAYGGWNEDARFPAASTVKLGVLIAALDEFGPRPERSRVAHDIRTLSAWSSNLAANRLLDEIGGSAAGGSQVAQATLRRLGAASSTYTGDYRAGTSVGAGTAGRSAPNPPPLVSQRVTTARDLGRILDQLHAAAFGDPQARQTTGLNSHEAQVGLTLLLASQPTRDNMGLFRPSLGVKFPMAQKNGWLRDAQHTAAILYGSDGPHIAVVLTYRSGLARSHAEALGARVAQLALR